MKKITLKEVVLPIPCRVVITVTEEGVVLSNKDETKVYLAVDPF